MTAADWLPAALNGGWTYRDRVPATLAGIMVTAFYAQRYRHSDGAVWGRRLAAGEIARNGEILRQDAALAAGDRLAWHRPPWLEEAVPAAWTVVHDDGDLLVIDKPSGLPVLPAGGWLEHTVLRLLERRHRGDAAGIPRPVHRLGRFTSGLLVCARQPATRAWLSAALRESTAAAPPEQSPDPERQRPSVRKLYRAWLMPGALSLQPGESLEIRTPIGRRPHRRLGWIWCAATIPQPGDLQAHSRLTLLERRPQGDLVQVAIGSGRPHQIRIHCAAIGAPLLGDPLYLPGGLAAPESLPGEGGYQLQAWRLELRRTEGERLVLEVPEGLGEQCGPGV
jgi:23S rRNA pseudouridine1911/1915/1917 synthase